MHSPVGEAGETPPHRFCANSVLAAVIDNFRPHVGLGHCSPEVN